MALKDGDDDNSNWRADPSGRARPLQNGNQGASRMPSMYGGEGETPVVERGVPLPASEVQAAGFGLFDPSSASSLQVLTCFFKVFLRSEKFFLFFASFQVFQLARFSKFFSSSGDETLPSFPHVFQNFKNDFLRFFKPVKFFLSFQVSSFSSFLFLASFFQVFD